MKKSIVLFDDGEKYLWEDTVSGELHTFQYGTFLIKMVYIGTEQLCEVYRDIIRRSWFERRYEKVDISSASDAYKELDRKFDEMLQREDEIYEEDTFSFNVPQDVSEMISNEERLIFELIMWTELQQIKNGYFGLNELTEKLIPQFLFDKALESDIEKILLGGNVSDGRVNEFLMMDMLCYVPQYLDDDLVKAYMISSLSQLFALEVMKVEKNKNNQLKYRKCPICEKIFVQKAGSGNTRKYCEYPYSKGLCAKEGQKKIDADKSDIENYRKRVSGRIRKYKERHASIHNDIYKWEDEFENFHQSLIEQGISIDDYTSKVEDWYKRKKNGVTPKSHKKKR